MFEAKEQAEAVVLAVEPPGDFSETDIHGIDWEHRKYILEVRPDPAALAQSPTIAEQALAHNARELAWTNHHTSVARPEPHHEPQWTVPAVCPECGARVDQFTGSAAEHPRCEYCRSPLPREQVQ
jgi:hypothetical protein